MVTIVSVRWLDAHTLGNEEVSPDEIDERAHKPCPTTSYGFLIRSDEKGVTLATDVQEWKEGPVYRNVNHIPRCMVVHEETREWTEKPRRKAKA